VHQRLLLSTHIVRGQLLVLAVHIAVQVNEVVGSFPSIPLLYPLTPLLKMQHSAKPLPVFVTRVYSCLLSSC
jgi:hypothetical protein